ncbi:hypothetical protein Val02_75450 [Virgisporangium aliadipatigenens]|uniref:PA domain-containing protein n=1 Tax=Virgisporangium aliadipatigenens TaxID=741659 RepID=A0A8J3YRR9_9ACTN|nr:PA domain-containing protein [Virgisporangium aliadipatigenens]GIJ50659.1 hypothetical protein Val02_75450 [Virgisporangium aliadipatigenens]
MQKRRLALTAPLVLLVALIAPATPASAHPDHGGGGREMFPGEGVVRDNEKSSPQQHAGLNPTSRGVKLVGKAEVTNPSGTGNLGRIADVSAYGNYAFLTAFREPTCENTGAHVINMKDPRRPYEVKSAFMPTDAGNYAGEGSDVISIYNRYYKGPLFIHQNETCPTAGAPTAPRTRGGINIWDIKDPEHPKLIVAHAGDYTAADGVTIEDQANQVHSQFAWTNIFNGRTYVVLVDDEEATDIDILDITDPYNPVLVNDTLNLDAEPFNVGQPEPNNLQSVFSHDMMVQRVGGRYVMNMSYWDGGYVMLDVTDPTPGNVSLITESDFATVDEEQRKRGKTISPEGNGHQSELSPDTKFLVAADEDFNPYRVVAKVTSGPYAGTDFTATPGPGAAPVSAETSIIGTPTFVGLACAGTVAPGTGIALIERGVCSFQEKLDTIVAAGYTAGIVFNAQRDDCLGQVSMSANGTIPFVFANRLAGLQLLGVQGVTSANACTTATPTGATAQAADIKAVFDGWGYLRLFKTDIPGKRGAKGSIRQIDTYAIPEAQNPSFSSGYGDLSVHEVALDPDKQLAYVSYYAGGFRIFKYGNNGLKEVGKFIDQGGNNFWGVEVHKIGAKRYVLASDRDFGLYIFQPDV